MISTRMSQVAVVLLSPFRYFLSQRSVLGPTLFLISHMYQPNYKCERKTWKGEITEGSQRDIQGEVIREETVQAGSELVGTRHVKELLVERSVLMG